MVRGYGPNVRRTWVAVLVCLALGALLAGAWRARGDAAPASRTTTILFGRYGHERVHTLAEARQALDAEGLRTAVVLDRDRTVLARERQNPVALLHLFSNQPKAVRGVAVSDEATGRPIGQPGSYGARWTLYVLESESAARRFAPGLRAQTGTRLGTIARVDEGNVVVLTFTARAEQRARAALARLREYSPRPGPFSTRTTVRKAGSANSIRVTLGAAPPIPAVRARLANGRAVIDYVFRTFPRQRERRPWQLLTSVVSRDKTYPPFTVRTLIRARSGRVRQRLSSGPPPYRLLVSVRAATGNRSRVISLPLRR